MVRLEVFGTAVDAGIAGMLAPETRTSSAVGVAISVTTIPAAAYLGVVLGLGNTEQATGALAVLAIPGPPRKGEVAPPRPT